jgi:hypothetical protein
MKRILKLLLICVVIVLGIGSCSKPIDYKIQVVNNTPYTINKLEFGGSVDGPVISIPPMKPSESFYITYNERVKDMIEEPESLISITSYSDENNTYTNTIWRYFKINEFNPNENNVISIQLDPLSFYEHDIFKFITN